MAEFLLDARLAADTLRIGRTALCEFLLMNDRRFPWMILVPRRPALTEFADLAADERAELLEEAVRAGGVLQAHCGADKLNIAQLGNIVAQLHVHVVARLPSDAAWPRPVFGFGAAEPYDAAQAAALIAALRTRLALA